MLAASRRFDAFAQKSVEFHAVMVSRKTDIYFLQDNTDLSNFLSKNYSIEYHP